jgi:putative flippase GtrA
VVDIKVFQLLFFLIPVFPLAFKAVSFVAGTFVKYWCDKLWTFKKFGKEKMAREMAKFFLVALGGMAINVVSFYFFGKIKTGLAPHIWTEACIILAAIVAGAWNFCGYKFIVFKK